MSATMYGWEIVWPAPIGRAASAYAPCRTSSGTKSSRGTRPIAASTRSSSIPRRRSCTSTIRYLASADTRDSEVVEHGRRHVGDPERQGVDTDGEKRDEGVAGDERAVAAAADVMLPAEVGELPALRGGDEQLAGVGIRERRAHTPLRIRMLELVHRKILAVAARDRPVALEPERDVDGRLAVEPPRELRRVGARPRQEIDLPRAIRRRDDYLSREIGEGRLEPRCPLDVRLAVIGQQDHGVTVEELVRPAGRVEQRADRRVGALEGDVGRSFRPVRVRGEVVVR